jgi:predicted esterase
MRAMSMRSASRALLLLTLLVGIVAPPARAKDVASAEAKHRARIAETWMELLRTFREQNLGDADQVAEALAQAQAADPGADGLEDLRRELTERAGAAGGDAAQRRLDAARTATAKLWDKVAALHEDEAGPAWSEALLRAQALDPSKKRIAALATAARKQPILLRTPAHPMVAFVSLPGDWKPGKPHPVLVTVEGAGANFEGNTKGFVGARGSRNAIVVTPFSLSSTNTLEPAKFPHYDEDVLKRHAAQSDRFAFDVPGLVAILDAVRDHLGGSERVAITGFSGGGLLCYRMTFLHSARVMGSAPACANFIPYLADGCEKPTGGGPAVHILTGATDPHRDAVHGREKPGIEGQSDAAQAAFERLGFERVRRTMLPGVGHSSCVREVWEFFDEVAGR